MKIKRIIFGGNTAHPYFCTPFEHRSFNKVFQLKVDLVAQLVEHNTFNVGVLGSSPSGITEA